MSKDYKIQKNIKAQYLVRGIINASFWHWHIINEIQHTEAIKYLNNIESIDNVNPSEAMNNREREKFIEWLEQEKEKIGKDIKAWKDCITCIIIDLKFEMKKEREQIEKRTKAD